eukprot:TRINITY_DN35615_c0_g1_i1.p1 TRINITY_DN35615_c0_g1~~TRINITY_DN35615_c0_g1_i1.p1  ORF type:complete len:210 (-),score=59.80 TRINITY_DN35615_c0_g1_i1:108-737(-)
MRKLILSLTLAMSVLVLGALPALAGGPVKTLPGDITLEQAQKVLAAALKQAVTIKVPMNIAIVDAGGNLKAFYRQEDAFIGSIDISIKKAVTARYFNMPTRALGAASQVGQSLYGIEVSNDGLILFAGGVPLVDANNVIIGAIGVSGGTVDEDEGVAMAGAAVLKQSNLFDLIERPGRREIPSGPVFLSSVSCSARLRYPRRYRQYRLS